MAEVYLTIQEAAEITGKSIQTIRRGLKTKKISGKRLKTPQGFSYLIKLETLEKAYDLDLSEIREQRIHAGLKQKFSSKKTSALKQAESLSSAKQTRITTDGEFVSREEFAEIKGMMDSLIIENQKDKESFMRFAKIFQERFSNLESQIKFLSAPGKQKRWYQFWKK